ncbi:MAG: CHASE2 domain-containing protein [Deltaproteobacteria bacterium]|nr:CHASE2 domain-containing protein [Deltaproteobacteria bacterium]
MSSPDHIKRQKQIFLLLVTVIGLSIIAVFLQLDFLKQLEYSTWDSRVRVVADPAKADPKIKIIVIDQESLEALAKDGITWPWPRSLYAPVIKYLEHAGAKGLAIDLLFTETSAWGVEEDIQFGEALNPNFPVINTVVLHKAKHSLPEDKFQIWTERSGFSYQRSIDFLGDLKVGTHQSLTLPTNEILEHSFWLGNVSENSDQDGIFRHYQIGGYVEELPFLNLPFALFASSNQSDFRKLDSFIGDNNQLTVNFHGPALTYDTYRFEPVLKSANALELGEEPRVKPENFENAWVFLGAQAPGLLDLRPTPLAAVYPGVEYHATVLDNYLHSDFIKKVSLPVTLLLCLVFLLLLNSSTLFFRSLRYELLAVLIALSAFIFLSGTLAAYNFGLLAAVPF